MVDDEEEIIARLRSGGYTKKKALALVGLSESTYHYRHHPRPRVDNPMPHHLRCGRRRISDQDRNKIIELLEIGFEQELSVRQIYYQHLDSGEPLLSGLRMFYRMAEVIRGVGEKKKRRPRRPATVPTVTATGPGQVFVWDVTWVKGEMVRKVFALHVVMDLFSRMIVGWTLQPRESKDLAVSLMENTIRQEGRGRVKVVHSDNGSVMTSRDMAAMLDRYQVCQSLIRPGVSNDNPHCEAVNRTLKYHRFGLAVYADIDEAVETLTRVVDAYNTTDYHSGVANFTPSQVYDGSWSKTAQARRATVAAYYEKFPERFNDPPRVKVPPRWVGINVVRPEREYLSVT